MKNRQIGHKGRFSAPSQRYRGRWYSRDGMLRPLETDGRLAILSNEHYVPAFLYADLHERSHATVTFQKRQPLSERLTHVVNILSLFMSPEIFDGFIGDLQEKCCLIVKERGHRSAQLWFWRQGCPIVVSVGFRSDQKSLGVPEIDGLLLAEEIVTALFPDLLRPLNDPQP